MISYIITSVVSAVVGIIAGGVFSYLFFRANPNKAAVVNAVVAAAPAAIAGIPQTIASAVTTVAKKL